MARQPRRCNARSSICQENGDGIQGQRSVVDTGRKRGEFIAALLFHRALFEIRRIDPAGIELFAAQITFIESALPGAGIRIVVEDFALAEHAWVLLCSEFLQQLISQSGLQGLIGRFVRQICQALGVFGDVIQFIRCPPAERQLPEMPGKTLTAHLEDLCFGGTAIAVQVTGFGVAGRPARGFVVVQIEHSILDNPADRIPPIVRSPDVVSFLSDEHMIAGRIHLAGFIRTEDVGQASAGGRLHTGLLPIQAGQFDKGRGEIDEANVIVNRAPGFLIPLAHMMASGRWLDISYS